MNIEEANKQMLESPGTMNEIDFFGDAEEPAQEVDEKSLERMIYLAEEMRELERTITNKEVELAELQEAHRKIQQVRLPTIMEAIGMSEFKLTDGASVTVKPDIKCGLTEERKPLAFAWLREKEFDGIIKSEVKLAFGKGENERSDKALELLVNAGFLPDVSENIHHSTLKSFVKECLEKGENIPLDTFGVFEFKSAKITLPKSRKSKR